MTFVARRPFEEKNRASEVEEFLNRRLKLKTKSCLVPDIRSSTIITVVIYLYANLKNLTSKNQNGAQNRNRI